MSAAGDRSGRPVSYWHGGRPGRRVGDLLLPARDTSGTALAPGTEEQVRALYPGQADRVYLTSDRSYARTHAATCDGEGGGSVYLVEPIGPVEADPDGVDEGEVACARARVLEVTEVDVWLSPVELVRGRARHMRWNDGSPMVDPEGPRYVLALDPALRVPQVHAAVAQMNEDLRAAQALWVEHEARMAAGLDETS